MTAVADGRATSTPPRDPVLVPAERISRARSGSRTVVVAGALVLLLGIAVRAYLVLSQPLPLNDGGLFYVMTRELEANGFMLPHFTGYNGLHVPYGYSPLGFYLAGLLDTLTPLSLRDAFRVLPLVASSLTVVAFYLLARQLLSRRAEAVAATAAFALLPRSYVWMLMGGGVTRAPGFLFAILALHEVMRFCRSGRWRYVATASLLSALTLLSHLGTAPFVAVSSILLLTAYGRSIPRAAAAAVLIGLGAAVLSAPWWGTVIAWHGWAPFHAALHTGEGILSDHEVRHRVLGTLARFAYPLSNEPLFPLIGALAVIGGFASLTPRRIVLPVWWVAILLLDARQGASFATVPVALLAGIGVADVLLPALLAGELSPGTQQPTRARRWVAAAVLLFLAVYAGSGALARDPDLGREQRFLVSLTPGDLAAMRWIARHTPEQSRFLVITGGSNGWSGDRTSEWFPVYAGRTSVATAQGYEWALGDTFRSRREAFAAFQRCSAATTACLDSLSRADTIPFTHVYVSQFDPRLSDDCCAPLKASLARDERYAEVYRGADGGAVFVRRDVISQRGEP